MTEQELKSDFVKAGLLAAKINEAIDKITTKDGDAFHTYLAVQILAYGYRSSAKVLGTTEETLNAIDNVLKPSLEKAAQSAKSELEAAKAAGKGGTSPS